MRVFKTKGVSKWAIKEHLDDAALLAAVGEIERGLIDADLGGHVIKKRIALKSRGKSGGARTLLAYHIGNKAVFIYGFAKSAKANITEEELRALKHFAKKIVSYTDQDLTEAVKLGVLIEVN